MAGGFRPGTVASDRTRKEQGREVNRPRPKPSKHPRLHGRYVISGKSHDALRFCPLLSAFPLMESYKNNARTRGFAYFFFLVGPRRPRNSCVAEARWEIGSRVHENRDFRLKVLRIARGIAWRDQVHSCQDPRSQEGESGCVQITGATPRELGRFQARLYRKPLSPKKTYGITLPAWTN